MVRFDFFSAKVGDWESYLRNQENLLTDYRGWPPLSPLERITKKVVALSLVPRTAVITNAVQAVLKQWDEIASMNTGVLSIASGHPFVQIPRFAHDENPHAELAVLVGRLWSERGCQLACSDQAAYRLIQGLGKLLPEDQAFLERLYVDSFDMYSFLALEVMLERKLCDRASQLFTENALRYPSFDPGVFDTLAKKGLALDALKVWLDQSINAQKGYEGHYDNALLRWDKLARRA